MDTFSGSENRTGASVAVPANGTSPDSRLHKAAFHGAVSQVRELLEVGQVEPCAPDKHGKRIIKGYIRLVKYYNGTL